MYAVILAGGKGKRFWPFSRTARPKQFLNITGEGSMLSLTFERLAGFIAPENIILMTVRDQLPLVGKELPALPPENILVEPVGRNTAPALAVAAEMIIRSRGDGPIVACPADHLIEKKEAFRSAVTAAVEVASKNDVLITFGIKPSRPETGYGYIETGQVEEERGGQGFHRVRRFHEKPGAEKAMKYVEKSGFYWNSGIFVWRPSVFLEAWSKYLPEGREPLSRIAGALGSEDGTRIVESEYPRMPSISVDYGILEKADNVLVAPVDLGWNDVGSWDALFEILPKNGSGNVVSGETEIIDSKGSLFFNPDGFTAAVGMEDIVVVVDGGTVLVCRRGESQRVRELTDSMGKKENKDVL